MESQKLQTRSLEGCTAPHCKHVFVTGAFCAADASTPARSDRSNHSMRGKSQAQNGASLWRIRQQVLEGASPRRRPLTTHLLGEHLPAESNPAV